MSGIRKILTLILCLGCVGAMAQPKKMVRKGNELYESKNYKEASAAYQEALKKNPTYTPGLYNLGNALYQQKQYDNARKAMDAASKTSKDKQLTGGAQYNIGNTYMEEQKWQEAVDAYKQALRNNPQDADAKYNLSYALQMMKKDGGVGKNDKDKQDDKKNQDKQDQNKQNQDQKDEQKKDEKQKDQQQKQDQNKEEKQEQQKPQPQPSKLSEKQAEQLLNALQQEEKKLHDKKQEGVAVPIKVEKDW